MIGPLLGDRTGASDASLIKPKGSVISCPNDHWLYRLTTDIKAHTGRVMKASDLECVEDRMPQPVAGQMMKLQCAYCGEPWRRNLPTSDVAEAAALFVAINRERIALTPLMVFKAELAAKAPEALDIVKVCLMAGVEPLTYPMSPLKPNQTIAISTLRSQVKADPARAVAALRAAVASGVGLTAVTMQCAFRAISFGTDEAGVADQLRSMKGVTLNTGAHSEFKRADVFFKMMSGEIEKPAPKPKAAPAVRKPFQFKRSEVVEPKAKPIEVRSDVPIRRFEPGGIESLLEKTFADSRVKYERWVSKRFVCKLDGVPTTLADAIARADAIRFKANLPPIARQAEVRV